MKTFPPRHVMDIDWSKGVFNIEEEVAKILLQLPQLISDSFFIWKGKKKRQPRKRRWYGLIKKDPATSDAVPEADITTAEEATSSKQVDCAASPDTPLIYSFSSSATNSKLLAKRKPLKRRRDDDLLLVTKLENERDLLRSKIEKLRQQKDRAMAINSLLKRQQELIHHHEKEKDEKSKVVNTSLTVGMQWQRTQPSNIVLSSSSVATVQRHGGLVSMTPPPLIVNPTVVVEYNRRSFLSTNLGLGPQKLMDLNLPADGCHVLENPSPLDPHVDKKMMATLARQKRCRIYRASRRNLVRGIRS